jgi:hypothetical protein
VSSNPPVDFDEPLPAKKVAHLFGTSEERLANDRYLGRGLPYVKFGRSVFYLRSDVTAYLAANRVVPGQGQQ